MQRIHLALGLAAALALSSCTVPKELQEASVVAYWSLNHPAALRCPGGGHGCANYFLKKNKLDDAVTDERALGNELVRLDAVRTKKGTVYVGVWQPHPPEHVYETELSTAGFQDRHADLAGTHRLEHFAVWQAVNSSRIAAVWRPRTPGEAGQPADVVELGLQLADFPIEKAGFYIDEIELYPPAIAGDPPDVAVVWRPGGVTTRVLHGERCEISDQRITASSTLGGGCSINAVLSGEAEQDTKCPAFQPIHDLYGAGFRVTDLEYYVEGDEPRLAVLLQDIGAGENAGADDWLMAPAAWDAVDCRHNELGPPANPELGLLDLDILPLDAWTRLGQETHNGLVHDSGTGGPP